MAKKQADLYYFEWSLNLHEEFNNILSKLTGRYLRSIFTFCIGNIESEARELMLGPKLISKVTKKKPAVTKDTVIFQTEFGVDNMFENRINFPGTNKTV